MNGATMWQDVIWAIHGDLVLDLGIQVGGIGALMLVIVAFVSLIVQIFSVEYMHDDVRYRRYYAVLSLFTFSMLGLVLADNLLFLFIFWELVGLCSYLLIGHWYESLENVRAANKAFLTTRVGDVGMFIGIMLLFSQAGTFRFDEIAAAIQPACVHAAAVDRWQRFSFSPAPSASRPSSRCTYGCLTRWPVRRRPAPSFTRRRWWRPVCTW